MSVRARILVPAVLLLVAAFFVLRGASPARPEQSPRTLTEARAGLDPAARAEPDTIAGADRGAGERTQPGSDLRRGGQPDSARGAAAAASDSIPPAIPLSPAGSVESARLTYEREFFYYDGAGRRDPFKPLLETDVGLERPRFEELRLTGLFLGKGGGMVVVEDADQKGYFLKPGDSVGNATLVEIQSDEAAFDVRDLGISRRETLELQRPEETP